MQPGGRHDLRQPRPPREPGRPAQQDVDDEGATDQDAGDRPGDRDDRVEEARWRDREPDEEEHDGRQEVGEELPDGVDRIRARPGHRAARP